MNQEPVKVQQSFDDAATKKLTNWKLEPSLEDLKKDFEGTKNSQSALTSKIRRWRDLLNVTGNEKPKKVKGRSSVQPKLIRRQAEWRYSALTEPFLGTQKLFTVAPVTFEDGPGAKQNELVINWQFRTKLNRVAFIDEYVRTAVDEGTVIVRVGWNRNVVKTKTMVPVYAYYGIETQEQANQLQQALQLKQENPRGFNELPPEMKAAVEYYIENEVATYAQEVDQQETEVETVLENCPTLNIVNPDNFYLDPTVEGDYTKALFCVYTFETNKAMLEKDGDRYKNLDKIDWNSVSTNGNPDHESNNNGDFTFKDLARRKTVAYEYWGMFDIHGDGNLVPIVATWIGNVLIRLEENPFPDGKIPFVLVPYLPIKRQVFGETDAELIEDNQHIIGAVMRGMIDLLGRSANGQQGIAKGMLDPLNRRRYENGEDYEYNPNINPANSLIEHKFPEIPQSAMLMLNLQNQEAESISGAKSFSGGISGEAYGDVAAGIRGVLDAASKREMAILRRLAKGITDIGTKICSMNAVFLSEQEVVRVTNDQFVTINREDLKGNYDLVVDIATAEVDNAKSQDLGFMLQTIGPKVDPKITMDILAEIADLKRMPELAHKLRNYKPEPDPVQEQMKQLELQKLQLENQELQSKIQLNMAKAAEAMANKDQKDLDYVEQETGTTHEREMAKQRAQSQGNQDLEITKALMHPKKPDESAPNVAAAVGYKGISDKMNDVSNVPLGTPTTITRDAMAPSNPALNLGSQYFDPS